MRRFAARPRIPQEPTRRLLGEKTKEIAGQSAGAARKTRARVIFDSSRSTAWFNPVIVALRQLAGEGELCMYCSSNEPSQVEHFYPLALFPKRALSYRNYLWACDICNRSFKGDKFPPLNHPGARVLNPIDDDVWEYFFIDDRFGRLVRRIDAVTGQALPRAVSTCDIIGIDRENVQIKRARRFKILKRDVLLALNRFTEGTSDLAELQSEILELRTLPFQSDVADYFLNGPGRNRAPFRDLLLAAGENVP